MKVGITGAQGFIGQLLVTKLIDEGHEIHILSRKINNLNLGVVTHEGNLMDKNSLNAFVENLDVLFHCAAEVTDESKMEAVNVEGTRNLVNAAKNKVKHWVQLSSVGVYGAVYEGIIGENHACKPNNEYERTKLKADELILDAADHNAFTYTLIRPSIVFGEHMKNNSLFELIKTIDKGYYFFIGKKGASANYVPVEHVVEALVMAGTNEKALNQIYNISHWCCIEDFVKLIAKKLEKPVPRKRVPLIPIRILAQITSFIPQNPLTVSRLKALSNRTIYSIDKIQNQLNFKSKYSMEEAVEKLVQKYKTKKGST